MPWGFDGIWAFVIDASFDVIGLGQGIQQMKSMKVWRKNLDLLMCGLNNELRLMGRVFRMLPCMKEMDLRRSFVTLI